MPTLQIDPEKKYTTKQTGELLLTRKGTPTNPGNVRHLYLDGRFPNSKKEGRDIFIVGKDILAEIERRQK